MKKWIIHLSKKTYSRTTVIKLIKYALSLKDQEYQIVIKKI